MKSITNYLDDVREITGSDYKTAKCLNLTKAAVSKIRKKGNISDENAIKLANLLGIKEEEIILSATIARSDGEVKKTWERISKLSGLLSFPIGAACNGLYQYMVTIEELMRGGLCILCKIIHLPLKSNIFGYYDDKNKFIAQES